MRHTEKRERENHVPIIWCKIVFLWVLMVGYCFANTAAYAQFMPQRNGFVTLRATYGEKGPEIKEDLMWRIYAVRGGDAVIVLRSEAANPSFSLQPGRYMVHVSAGLASATRELSVGDTATAAILPINVGALVVGGHIGGVERPIAVERQSLALYIPIANNSEGKLVTDTLRPWQKIYLPAGVYHLVSTYSGSNSVVRSNVKVETGKITEAMVNHRAATMTLKLVRQKGGVALADTEWMIETPGGDIVSEAVGAFPSVEIAEGTYSVLARHREKEYHGQMKVEGGMNRDFELVVE